jgi:hypothetical protein
MANPFAKTRPIDQPYAVYEAGTMTWRILKTYKLAKNETGDPYARWMVAAKSDATFGSFDMGDTYAQEVRGYGRLVAAEPDWLDAYGSALDHQRGLPTPAEYLELESNA